MTRGMAEQAQVIIPKLREVEVELGSGRRHLASNYPSSRTIWQPYENKDEGRDEPANDFPREPDNGFNEWFDYRVRSAARGHGIINTAGFHREAAASIGSADGNHFMGCC